MSGPRQPWRHGKVAQQDEAIGADGVCSAVAADCVPTYGCDRAWMRSVLLSEGGLARGVAGLKERSHRAG